jgi:hypothetical protein
METQPTPVTHIFKEINKGKYATVKHYELAEVKNGESLLESTVQIANNRAFAKSKPMYWFTHRKNNKWVTPRLTGLFPTDKPNVFNGDIDNKTNLLFFIIDEVSGTLTVYYYKEYFTYEIESILNSFK